MDAAESERMGERMTRANLQRAERGEWHGGSKPPWGYRFAPGEGKLQLAIVEERAAMVREAATRVLAGESLYSIRKDWNDRGALTTAGLPWRCPGIRKMLVRGSSAGYIERDGRFLKGAWQPILEYETWQQVRALLMDPRRNTRSLGQRGAHFPLTGLVYCGWCGHLMYSSIVRYGMTYWCPDIGGCAHVRIRGMDLERLVHELITERQASKPLEVESDPVLTALRLQMNQLQDDHYDRLLDRLDFLRQGDRLRKQMTDRRREITAGYPGRTFTEPAGTATMEDDEAVRRHVLHQHLDRIVAHPHVGNMKPPADWPRRAAQLLSRVDLYWQNGDISLRPDVPEAVSHAARAVDAWAAPL
jgi:site-specific DNA recombinase